MAEEDYLEEKCLGNIEEWEPAHEDTDEMARHVKL